ncbi:MAG: GNAT family N-acetyltransferase [Methylophilaceae bacterium]|nr:GNAT family N-acetyltransferase [Methylophilaceae bacterium]
MVIQRYQPESPEHFVQWNQFVRESRNGTFLFDRNYMDYHATRFYDFSLMVMSENKLIAVIPANRVTEKNEDNAGEVKTINKLITHGGLTFGGLVMSEKLGAVQVLAIFEHLREYLRDHDFQTLVYKAVPHIYHRVPSEDDMYALHRLGANKLRMDVSTTIMQSARLPLAKGRKHAMTKAHKAHVTIKQTNDYASFWQILTSNLQKQHATQPTHSLDEISLLATRFGQIQLWMAYLGDKPVAGVVIYAYDQVAHTQYIASTDESREIGALDMLLEHLITAEFAHKPYVNFGISTTNAGLHLNAGLIAQKEMFGGRSTVLQWLELSCI